MSREPSRPSRIADLRAAIASAPGGWRTRLSDLPLGWSLASWGAFVLISGLVAIWARQQPLVAVGRVMNETRTVTSAFQIEDELKTEAARDAARQRCPRVYIANDAVLNGLRESIRNLPRALADVDDVSGVEPTLSAQYGLTTMMLGAVQEQFRDGELSQEWSAWAADLDRLLRRSPLLDSQAYQLEVTAQNELMELRPAPAGDRGGEAAGAIRISARGALNVESPDLPDEMRRLAAQAGFTGPLVALISNRLTHEPAPTYAFDKEATEASQAEAAAAVPPQVIRYPEREVIFHRGDVLTPEQLKLSSAARVAQREGTPWWGRLLSQLGLIGVVAAVGFALAGYTAMFCPRIRRNPVRAAAVATLLAFTVAVSCAATVAQPGLIAQTAVAPTLFASLILIVAYDQRVALAYGVLTGLIVAAALNLPVTMYALIVAGVGSAVWRIKEIRDRHTLIVAGALNATVLAAGMFLCGLVELPVSRESLAQNTFDAALCGLGGLVVSGVTVFVLPLVERAFDITTGLTLIELRDPKQPLLRQLQQRAPGTYNHSLNVASLAEAAADAIGADGLLAYVGSLYHDIGKMNKPEYFVENQTPGLNKHDRLSPAMSLLIIVGHVKDGVELAREFRLPRSLHHFIESHHGTTLVEYFYHRARKRAEEGVGIEEPAEIEYRYPGPKPSTKEAALVMLCDAMESTTRAMADPTPSRIDTTVRTIANRRLLDGQFDQCDLSLRELNTVVETVSRTLAAIYHGRIAYPTGAPSTAAPEEARVPAPKTAPVTNGRGGGTEETRASLAGR